MNILSILESFCLNHYFTVKALHFFSLIAWFAGLFYLPRLFVYHTSNQSEEVKSTLDVMAGKLYRIIMMPAMLSTLLFGSLLSILPHNRIAVWLHVKLLMIILLILFQFFMNHHRLLLLHRRTSLTSRTFRMLNELPTIMLAVILFCAIFKPF